jgi:hypothetical protein
VGRVTIRFDQLTSGSLGVHFISSIAFTTLRVTEERVHIERAGSAYVRLCLSVGVRRTGHANVGVVVSVRASSAYSTDSRSCLGNLQENMEIKKRINEDEGKHRLHTDEVT